MFRIDPITVWWLPVGMAYITNRLSTRLRTIGGRTVGASKVTGLIGEIFGLPGRQVATAERPVWSAFAR